MKVFRKSVFWQHYKAGRLNRQVSYFKSGCLTEGKGRGGGSAEAAEICYK
ncbi:hypothetical protein [Neisseria sicca]|nr:hypothetical protein [Neisseria sicca]